MYTYSEWYDFAEWADSAWKRGYSAKEIAESAYIYYLEYELSLAKGKATRTISELLRRLFSTEAEEATAWFSQISENIRSSGGYSYGDA